MSEARTWTQQLAADLVRINRAIETIEADVSEGISRLKKLEREREDVITRTLGGNTGGLDG
jgi:hypothetical protein